MHVPITASLKRSRNQLSGEEIDQAASHVATKRLKVCTEGDSNTFNLQDVNKVRITLESTTGVSRDVIIFAKSEPGSVILTFLVPASVVGAFTDISKRGALLAASGILWITVEEDMPNLESLFSGRHIEVGRRSGVIPSSLLQR